LCNPLAKPCGHQIKGVALTREVKFDEEGVLYTAVHIMLQKLAKNETCPNVALRNAGPPDQLGVWSSGPRFNPSAGLDSDATYNECSLTCLISTQ
jgi:hypothetical protein